MTQNNLMNYLLQQAEDIRLKTGDDALCASHIAAAVAEFCKTKYTGFETVSYYVIPYEEERLRYLFSNEVKMASYFGMRLSSNRKRGITEDAFDLFSCERIAAARGLKATSADVLFLCALQALHPSYKPVLHRELSDDAAILARLQDTDVNIYDYVVARLTENCAELKQKADQAAAIRDWKPVAKFAEPQEVADRFFGDIRKQRSGNTLTICLSRFFGTTDLKVSIHQAGDVYYVHDNGCAIRHLTKQVQDLSKRDRILRKVCAACWIDKGRVTGNFCTVRQFMVYLQMLVFVAHADLYDSKVQQPLYYRDRDYVYIDADRADSLDESALLKELKNAIHFEYDENSGLYGWLDTKYSLSGVCAAFVMESLPDGSVRISDKRKGNVEGEIFEAFYWCHDDIAPYSRYISTFAARFGAEFDGLNVYVTARPDRIRSAIFRFFNLSVLLSEFGHHIDLPAIRKRGKR